jgi:beta-lactamase regulating signal transducer with metallopeptidase domain
MPFSMGYWLSNAYDRVESSLTDVANPGHTPSRVTTESSFESTEIAFDNPALEIPATTKDFDTFSTPNQLQSTDNMVVPPPDVADLARDRAVGLTWQAVLFGLWLVVCMGTGLQVMRKTLLLKRLVRQSQPANKGLVELFESCRKRMLIGRDVGLRVSSVVPTPAVYGFFRPIVLIPKRMICHDFETKELEAIFTHELVHIQRCDLWVKLLQTILQVVYFYNPLLWLANATIRRVRELAVDEAVLVILGKSTSEVYPRTLLKVAGWAFDQPMHGLRLIGVMESNNLLTERINIMLEKPIPHSKKVGIIGLGILFVLGVFLLPMARAGVAMAPEEIAPSKAKIAESKTKIAKDIAEINVMKADIESLQLAIQMKLDELHQKEVELKLMRQDLNAKMHALGLAETTPNPSGYALAAVAPSDTGLSQAGTRGKQTGGWVAVRSNGPTEPGAKLSGTGLSPAGTRGKQTGGGMMMAAVPASSALPRGSQPTGGRVPAAFSMPPAPGATLSKASPPPAGTRGKQTGGRMVAALAMPGESGVAQDRMLGEDPLPGNISDEVRKELQRILPGLLRELLPKLLKEAQTKTVESPSLVEQF